MVDGEINGEKVGVLLDTGSASTLVTRDAAERLNLARSPAAGLGAFAASGETNAEPVVIEELRIGGATRNKWRALVVGQRPQGDDVALLLGHDFLLNFDIEFDLLHNTVRFYEPLGCENAFLAYWSTDASEVQIEVERATTFEVQANGRRVRAMLDSGSLSVLAESAATRLGITPLSPGVAPAGCLGGFGRSEVEVWSAPLETVTIGNQTIERPRMLIGDVRRQTTLAETRTPLLPPLAGASEMLLGIDFLRSHRVLVSHSQRRMYFSYVGGTVFPRRPSGPCSRK